MVNQRSERGGTPSGCFACVGKVGRSARGSQASVSGEPGAGDRGRRHCVCSAGVLRHIVATPTILGEQRRAIAYWVDANLGTRSIPSSDERRAVPVRVTAYQNEFEDAALSLFNRPRRRSMCGANSSSRWPRPPGDPEKRAELQRWCQSKRVRKPRDALPELIARVDDPHKRSAPLWLTVDTHGTGRAIIVRVA